MKTLIMFTFLTVLGNLRLPEQVHMIAYFVEILVSDDSLYDKNRKESS